MKEKVLHVSCGGLGYGGVSAVIFSIVESLYDQIDFDCVVFKKHCKREELFLKYGRLFRIAAYNNGRRNYLELLFRPIKMYFGIFKICKNGKYQAIHCHNNMDEGICLLAAKHAGVPVRIAHSHNTPSPKKKSGIVRIYEAVNRKLMLHSATDKIGCSDAACSTFYGKTDYKVIYNAVDFKKYNTSKRIQHDIPTFIHVGRYTFQKNQEFTIRVFSVIHSNIPDSQLLLVGYGEDKDKLERLVYELHLENAVKLVPGDRVDVSEMYSTSDYMLFPSNYEGFGIVLIEAQAMGIPCFVSEAIQKEADVGLLHYIPLENGAEAWAKTILKCIKEGISVDNDAIAKRLSRYSKDAISKQYASLYRG